MPVPERFEMTEEQYQDILGRAKFEIEDAKESLRLAKSRSTLPGDKDEQQQVDPTDDMEEDLARFNLDEYSDEDQAHNEEDLINAMSNVDEAALGGDDPYLPEGIPEEIDEEDIDDLHIRPTDNLLIACRTEDDISCLEVYVYEEEDDNLYVHHDIMLPSFPLCAEWIGSPLLPGQEGHGNFAAIGTFEPEIEIWNLDVLEVPYPSLILGQVSDNPPKKTLKKKSSKKITQKTNPELHTDAVMSLSWNRLHSSLLVSGSADTTIKLWDLNQAKALRSYEHHTGKVQALQWNTVEASILASAAYDHKVVSLDCRTPGDAQSWKLHSDPECLRWNPHQPFCFAVSDEDGRVTYFDTRAGSNSDPLFILAAHPKAVTSIDWNPSLPDCLLTVSADKSLKLWNTQGQIACVAAREVGVGKVFCSSFCFDTPNLISVAGSNGALSIINLLKDRAIIEGFQKQC